MSILVTGGAGFIGSHLVERLIKDGQDVVILDDFNDYYSPSIKRKNISMVRDKIEVIEKDIRGNLDGVFAENKISSVVHLAARAGVRASLKDPILYNDVNVLGTINLLEQCGKNGIKKFIFGSSSSVYGVTSRLPFKEDDPLLNPISPYAVTKIAGEDLCRVYSNVYDISIVCLRFFTVYGPRQRPEMAIHKFVKLVNDEKPIPYYGDGSTSRDYTYYSDIIEGIAASLNSGIKFEIINLGDSNRVTLKEMVCIIEDEVGKKARLTKMPAQEGDVPVTYANIEKAGKLLGYKPKIDIKEGIKRFVEWYKDKSY